MVIQHSIQQQKQSGFTLVELSIVLVIIGLIVSGVLVGQDMIRAAEIRSTISQVESYNTAVNTFRDKYTALPGDITANKAAQFGFQGRAGTAGLGDGNRLIEMTAGGITDLTGEIALFWDDLSVAGLLGLDLTAAIDDGAGAATLTTADLELWLPPAEIGQGHFITVYGTGGRNYFQIAQATGTTTSALNINNGMTPQTAFNIDDKLDDGNPFRGNVRAAYGAALNEFGAATTPEAAAQAGPANVTIVGGTNTVVDCAGVDPDVAGALIYATKNEDTANAPACQLRIKASF